ncbi:MAG: hypothetical protein U1E17_02690 [Geminicoccaceae bacterium]
MAIGSHGYGEAFQLAGQPDPDDSELAAQLQHGLIAQLRSAADTCGPLPLELPPGMAGGRPEPGGATDRLRVLRARLAKPETSGALALASFVPWLAFPGELELAGLREFRELHFDARCPTGVRGTPPMIDFLALGPQGAVGVSVHGLDYLGRRARRSAAAYAGLELPLAQRPWGALLDPPEGGSATFRHVEVGALAKLAVGLGQIFAGRPVRLLYLFLEPAGGAALRPFRRHRAELAEIVAATAAGSPTLVPMSLQELWTGWLAADPPAPVRAIVAQLVRRYAMVMPAAKRL